MKTTGKKMKCSCHGKERMIVKNHPRLGKLCLEGNEEMKGKKKKETDYKKICWEWFSKYIRLKYADSRGIVKCFTCSTRIHWSKSDCGHGVPRKFSATFLDERNNHPQCTTCNWTWEGRKEIYAKEVDKKYGEGTWDMLNVLAQSKFNRSNFEYKILATHFRQKFQELEHKKAA